MELQQIEIDRKEVEEELAHIKQAIKEGYISKRTVLARDLMAVYGHLKHGGKIVDVFKAFHKSGVDKNNNPKLAIVSFDAKKCYLYKKNTGGAIFSKENKDRWKMYPVKRIGDVELPADTYDFKEKNIIEKRLKTAAPIIPPRVLTIASTKLIPHEYHIIFEVEEWTVSKAPKPPVDPILVKRLTSNIFGVIATWKLSELEQSIIKGRM